MRNSARLLVPLLNDGIRLLVYSGEADGLANFMVGHTFPSILS